MMKRLGFILMLLLLGQTLMAQSSPVQVVATTTIIADVARNVGGELVNVTAIVPPNADEHAYQPVPQDVAMVESADLVLVNGGGLESFLGDLIQDTAMNKVVVVSYGIEALASAAHSHEEGEMHEEGEHEEGEMHEDEHHEHEHVGIYGVDTMCGDDAMHEDHDHEEGEHEDGDHEEGEQTHRHGPCDSHFWTDPANVMVWTDNIAAAFAELDPANAETYLANAEAYKAQLEALDAEIETILEAVPAERRVIVVNHRFLGYFAARYGFEVVGVVLPGDTTLAEPTPQEIAALVEVIREENVPAIFVEVSDSNRMAQIVASEAGNELQMALLYSGSLSEANEPAATYVDYMRYNVQTIADALSN